MKQLGFSVGKIGAADNMGVLAASDYSRMHPMEVT